MQLSDIPDLVIPTTFAPATTHRAARPVEWSLGLEHALLDERALTALNTLVTGPVTSWDTVESAELALRSFILHKRADCLLPAVLLTHRSTHSLHAIRYASPVEPEAILSVVKATGMHNRPVFTEWLSVRDRRILDKSSFWTGKEDVLFGPELGLRATFNEYLQSDGIGSALAATPTAIGAPSYFGIGPLRVIEQEALKEHYPRPGSRFYDNLDQQWRDHLKVYEHAGFDVRIGPLVTIVLTRASRREEIPEIVLELRSKFARAGEKLWQMLAELQLEKDPSRLLKKCQRLEQASKSIIPAAFRTEARPLRIAFDIVKSLPALLGTLEVIAGKAFDRNVPMQHASSIDAARLLAKELRKGGRDVLAALQRHLHPEELAALTLPSRS